MKLVLPKKLRLYTRSLIARRVRARYLIPASILLGGSISLIELACTGQVYLPTILYVIADSPNARAYALLALYNVTFIVPLLVVFGLLAAGLSSRRLARFSERHLAKTKILLAGVFAALGVGLLLLALASPTPERRRRQHGARARLATATIAVLPSDIVDSIGAPDNCHRLTRLNTPPGR